MGGGVSLKYWLLLPYISIFLCLHYHRSCMKLGYFWCMINAWGFFTFLHISLFCNQHTDMPDICTRKQGRLLTNLPTLLKKTEWLMLEQRNTCYCYLKCRFWQVFTRLNEYWYEHIVCIYACVYISLPLYVCVCAWGCRWAQLTIWLNAHDWCECRGYTKELIGSSHWAYSLYLQPACQPTCVWVKCCILIWNWYNKAG